MNQLVVKIELDSGICFSIDASNLDAPTTIFFAGDTSITITPGAVGEVTRDKRFNLNRRENDRRRAGFPGGKAQITRRIHYGDRFFAKQNTES